MATSYINYFPVSSVIKVVEKSYTIPADVASISISSDTYTDYNFVCWMSVFSRSGATTLTIINPMSNNATVYKPGSALSYEINFVVLALYVHK